MTTTTNPKKKLSPYDRIVRAIALLLEGVEPNKFDEAYASLLEGIQPRAREAWAKRRLNKQVLDPLTAAMQTGDVQAVLRTLSHNDDAMAMLNDLHAGSKQR